MDRKKPIDDGGKSQVKGFIAAARELGCDESEERFDAALGKIVKHKPSDAPVKKGDAKGSPRKE